MRCYKFQPLGCFLPLLGNFAAKVLLFLHISKLNLFFRKLIDFIYFSILYPLPIVS